MTPHLWRGQEASSEDGIPEDNLKDGQGLARKGKGGVPGGGSWWFRGTPGVQQNKGDSRADARK